MKKFICYTGALILTSSAVTILATNVNNYHLDEKAQTTNIINWGGVDKYNQEYFNDIKQNYYKKSNLKLMSSKSNKQVDIEVLIDFAKKKADSYMKKFQKESADVNQIITSLSKENPEFNKVYQENLSVYNSDNLNSNNFSQLWKNSTYRHSMDIIQTMASLQSFVKAMKILKTYLTTLAAAAAVAAAAFWAAAWWFGVTIPWATNCTIIATAASIPIAILNFLLVKFDEEQSKWDRFGKSLSAVYNLGHFFSKYAKATLITTSATLSATSWAFPAAIAVIAVISATLAWMDLF